MVKNFANMVMLLFLVTSCRNTMHGVITKTPEPYVKLNSGRVIQAKNVDYKPDYPVEMKWRWGTGTTYVPRITCNDTAFRLNDVAVFCSGSRTFGDIGKKRFACKFCDGNINIYVMLATDWVNLLIGQNDFTTLNYSIPLSGIGAKDLSQLRVPVPHRNHPIIPHMRYYIGNEDTGQLYRYNYANLRKMIPRNTQSSLLLNDFKIIRNITAVTTFAGIIMTIIGSNKALNAPALGYSGIVIGTASLIIHRQNHKSLDAALYSYNGLE